MTDETTPAEAVEAEETAPNRIWLLPDSISRERLAELRIRIMEEHEFTVPVEGQPEPMKIPVWGVSERARNKLRDAGYGAVVDEDPELKIKILVLTNPDGALSKVGVDPRTIKIVRMENSGMAAPMQQWFKEQILAKLSPIINAPISVIAGNGSAAVAAVDAAAAKFQIGFASSPILMSSDRAGNRRQLPVPATVWGARVSVQPTLCDIWQAGNAIISDEGVEVGAADEHNICIYWRFDAMSDVESTKTVLGKILDTVVAIRANPGAFKTPEALVKANYVRACSNRVEGEQRQLREQVEQRQREVIDYGNKLIEATRLGEHARATLNGFAVYAKDMNGRLGSEFDSMKHIKNVTDVSWRGDSLVVTTDDIFVVDPRTGIEHDIGKFKILLDHNRAEPHMFNLTRRVDGHNVGMHHPHVFPSGNPCLGNMAEALPVALAQYQWTVVVQLCLVFLHHVNVEDVAGACINRWPVSDRYQRAEAAKKAALTAGKEVASV